MVILFLHYVKITLGDKPFVDHPSYDETISSFCNSNPNAKICRHLKLKSAYKLYDKLDKSRESDNVVQSPLKSNLCGRKVVENRPPLQPVNNVKKRSTDLLKTDSSEVSAQQGVNNTEENDWNNKINGTFQTFANMFNRIPLTLPSANIIEQDLSPPNSIEIPLNSSSCNVDDTGFINMNDGSSFNEPSENNNNAVNYYRLSHNDLNLESMRLPDQSEDITKNNWVPCLAVELKSEKPPPDWVFSSGGNSDEAKSDGINFVLSNTHDDNKNPPDWIFSPPENVAQYKSNSKLADESEYSEWNVLPLDNLELEAELVDSAARDYGTQFNEQSNSVLSFHDGKNGRTLDELDKTHPKSSHQKCISKSRESQLKKQKLLRKREESMIDLDSLRNLIMKNSVSSNNDHVVGEKNKRRSLTNGRNIKNSNTKEAVDQKNGISRSKFEFSTPSMIHTHRSSEKTTPLPVSNDSPIKLNKLVTYLVKNSTDRNSFTDEAINNKSSPIRMKSEPTLITNNPIQEKPNHTIPSVKESGFLRSFVNTHSEKPNYNAFQKGVPVNNRDYPKISNGEGSYIEQLLKTNSDINKFNVSDESYVILRSKELQRMKNVLLNNFKQMIVNNERKSDQSDKSTTCYYPWELTTIDTCSQSESTANSEGCTVSPNDGLEGVPILSTISQDTDRTVSSPSTSSQDVDTIASTSLQDIDTIASTPLQDIDMFSPTLPTTPQDVDVQEDKNPNQLSDSSSTTEPQSFSETTQQQLDQIFTLSSNDFDSSNNKVTDNLGCQCQVEDLFTEGLYYLLPAKGVNAIKCALENSRKIYMGSSITGKFIASIDVPNMIAKDRLSNDPSSTNFTIANDTVLRETIEHILRNKKNGEVELQQESFYEGENGVGLRETEKEGGMVTLVNNTLNNHVD